VERGPPTSCSTRSQHTSSGMLSAPAQLRSTVDHVLHAWKRELP
jgi:hypothetical protein